MSHAFRALRESVGFIASVRPEDSAPLLSRATVFWQTHAVRRLQHVEIDRSSFLFVFLYFTKSWVPKSSN